MRPFDSINWPLALVTSGLGAASVWLDSTQTYRLHPLSVAHTLMYTQRKRIRAGNSVFGLVGSFVYFYTYTV